MNAIMVTVTNDNMNMVMGRKSPFVNLWYIRQEIFLLYHLKV